MSALHRKSLAAWADLKKRGGLELSGRDEGFETDLKNRLFPSAPSLEEALRTASTDDLVRAFFDLLQPFVAMFRSILDFFEKAGAIEGREQWNIVVDDVDFRLDHFRRFLKKWDSIRCEIEVPAVDSKGAWALLNASRDMPEMEGVFGGQRSREPYWSGVSDIDDWLRAYRAGRYEELPPSLAPSKLAAGYSDAAALAVAALQIIGKGYRSREELVDEWRKGRHAMDWADALSPRTIAANESDLWLGTLVARLGRSLSLQRTVKQDLGKRLQEEFARYPRRKFGARIKIADLESYLSLPVWKKRHELYAVWIATEIVNALPDHQCEIDHENGKIVFAFRETLVATVKSSWPPVRIISERRVPLAEPVGKGRTGNVQPDYGLWRQEAGSETCGLVIEVKHYKHSAASSFGDVLVDYSRALCAAQVFLVNHGPVGDATRDVPRDLLERCHTIENLTASNLTAREELSQAVRTYVGKPILRPASGPAGKRRAQQADTVLAIDVSTSMAAYLQKPEFLNIVRDTVDDRCVDVALIDVEVRALVSLAELPDAIAKEYRSGTGLVKPVQELLSTFKRVLLLTDESGFDTLTGFTKQTVISRSSGLVMIEVLAG